MKLASLALTAALVLAPAAAFAQSGGTIYQRKDNQQDRIAQGVRSGQLTAGETSRLERQEAGINREERGMRAQDNGHLTRQDRRILISRTRSRTASTATSTTASTAVTNLLQRTNKAVVT